MKEQIEPTFPMVMVTVSTVLAYNDCSFLGGALLLLYLAAQPEHT